MPHDPAHADALASQFTHVRILLGMVVGLGLTHLIRHFARIIDRPVRERTYWVHLLWAVSMFVYLLHFWWWEFRLAHLTQWTFVLYLYVALYALLLYLLCAIIFPDSMEGYADYEDYFYSRRKWFFGLLALAYVVDLGDTGLKGRSYFEGFGPELALRSLIYVVLCLVAIATPDRRFHAAFVVAGLLYQLSWIVRQFETL
ncbi:hypothetical protein IP90_00669 [Luteimonas cucumeris]|uniref:Uncharacterized protein n=1 Tax=Luteimonas cucumeris TaxID=985012 RepID=A0A562LAE2_9GAMM|nr:hypothetical protein [Luteimonas cucumeris]TWI04536.1 hypothetical protein IP90_00669 [Luteimonas cucumeris]